jgi:hypothetical protein
MARERRASVVLIDQLDRQIDAIASEPPGTSADHPYVPLPRLRPASAGSCSIACDRRFLLPTKLALSASRVIQSGKRIGVG